MSGRLSVNINDETRADLLVLAEKDGTVTEAVRRAVTVYKFLLDAERDGQEIQLADPKGATQRVVIL